MQFKPFQKHISMNEKDYLHHPATYRPVKDESLILEKDYYLKNSKAILLMNQNAQEDYDILFSQHDYSNSSK